MYRHTDNKALLEAPMTPKYDRTQMTERNANKNTGMENKTICVSICFPSII